MVDAKEKTNLSESEASAPAESAPIVEQQEFGKQPETSAPKKNSALADESKALRAVPQSRQKRTIPTFKDEVSVKIEKIMEEGLEKAYQELSPIAQQEFKMKGESAAIQIRELLKSTHVKVKKIFRLILEWLKMLPGINKFFLEQEAKIKTDKIIAIKKIGD